MWFKKIIFFCVLLTVFAQDESEEEEEVTTVSAKLAEGEKKLSEKLLVILDHFKQPDPVGLPGADIPDPCPVPDMRQSLSIGTLNLKNTVVYGISKLRILYVNANIGAMEVEAAMNIEELQSQGNYSIFSWFGISQGPFTVNITGMEMKAKATLGIERDGKLQAQHIKIDLKVRSISTNFENLGYVGGMLQGLINTGGPAFFDSSVPSILKEVYPKVRAEINKKLDEVAGDMQFPNSISPLDMVIIDVRKQVRDMKLDPFKVNNYNATVSIFTVNLSNTWVTGISSFQRVGNITLKMENNTVVADFEIGTQKLEGRTQWDISAIRGHMSRAGTASFSVEYISARVIVAQPLDTREKPVFRDIDLDIGNIQARCDGAGTLDYVVEFAVNILPNLLRYQIMNALEGPLKERVQKELDELNVEEIIKDELIEVDEMEQSDFKLSNLVEPRIKNEKYDEDEFFNF